MTHDLPSIQTTYAQTHWLREIEAFDALEIHPCMEGKDSDGTGYVEQCEPAEAHFWTVYGHYRTGCVNAFEDFLTEADAIAFRDRLIAAYPHLFA
jgi:hypothetical protein